MSNPIVNKTAADLDLSGIPGIEGLSIPGVNAPAPVDSEAGSEGSAPQDHQPSEPADYSAYDREPQGSSAPEPTASSTDAQDDLWAPLLGQVPEPLHQEIRPTLDEYQRQISRRDEQLAQMQPFQEWIQRGLTPQDIVMALQTQQEILTNPRAYWDQLGSRFGWNVPQQVVYAPPPQQQQAQGGEFDDIFGGGEQQGQAPQQQQLPPELQQALQQVQQGQQQMAQWQQQQQQAQIIAQGRQRIEQELNDLEQRYGQFDRQEVQRRAFVNAQTGKGPDLTAAFHEMKDYENSVARRYAAQRPQAPAIIGGGNGQTPPVKTDLSTPEARAQAAYQLALQMGADNPNGRYVQ